MSARDRLDRALLDLASDGRRVRCAEPEDHLWWTSDLDAEREAAARLCVGCPVLRQCAESAKEEHELFVWAGVDHGTRPAKKKTPSTSTTRPGTTVPGTTKKESKS